MRSEKSLLYKKNKLEQEVNLLIDAFENNGYQSYPENINYIGSGILRKEISGAKNKVKHLVQKIKDLENIKNDIETRHGLKNKSALEINELIKERINEGHYEILKDNIESNIKENKYQNHKESKQNKLPIKINNKDTYRDIEI